MYTIIYTCCLGLACMAVEVLNLRKLLVPLILAGLAVIFYINILDWDQAAPVIIGGMDMSHMMHIDRFSVAFSGVSLFAAALLFLLAGHFYKDDRQHISDYLTILVFILAGTLILFSFTNLVMLFLGIEIVSISLYILAGSRRFDTRSNEAGFKYFLMGSFASAVLLFGIALIYGASGSFNIDEIAVYASSGPDTTLLHVGTLLVISALLFKVAAVPFHFWSPDVYEGSPSLVTAVMSTIVKVAFFAGFYRLMANGLLAMHAYAEVVLMVVAALTMIAGNLIAINQVNFKRLLAYSGISHAGYMLLAILSVQSKPADALLFYGTAYMLATIGAFAAAIPVFASSRSEDIDAFNGMGKQHPLIALTLTLCMLSLAGIPPLAGFLGKYYIFSEAVRNGYIWLTVIAVLGSVVGVYYYFKVILAMFTKEAVSAVPRPPVAYIIVMFICTLLSIVLGVFPGMLTQWI